MAKTKIKLNQFDDLRERFKAKRAAKKPFEARGSLANEGRRKEPKPAHDDRFFNVKKYDNWLAPTGKIPQ